MIRTTMDRRISLALAFGIAAASLAAGCGRQSAPDRAAAADSAGAAAGPCADPLAVEVAPADRAAPRYAHNFTIEYVGRDKLVTVRNPWRGTDLVLEHVLVPDRKST